MSRAMKRYPIAVIVALILLLAGWLRFYQLLDYPAGFFCDEASIGYNAFTILQSGRDEHGARFPLYFRAFGEYKNPVYIYCTVPFVGLFGLDEFSTRFSAALFGVLTVLFTFFLFREMFSTREGVLAALLAAICGWHIHFSRIAFELISLPCLFTLGLFLLYRGTVRRSAWLFPGAFFMGLSLYTYGTAKIFVPLFLLGYVLLFVKYLWSKKLATLLAICIFAGTAYPVARYSLKYPERARSRFKQISIFNGKRPAGENARLIWENYKKHFSYRFLFTEGDPVKRHSVSGFGELYRADIPFYILGLLVLLLGRRREGILLLWWLALFPLAASITKEVPSATRSIVAIPLLPGIAAVGLALVFRQLLAHRRLVLKMLGCAVVAAYGYYLTMEFGAYMRNYYTGYPRYSAEGIYGFQYGYRDMLNYMQSQRGEYDKLIVTSRFSNRPDILIKFYTADPSDYLEGRKPLCRPSVFRADEYGRYSMKDRNLYALRPEELDYFIDYEIKKDIREPRGGRPFVVAHVKKRKEYIRDWLLLGLFDNRNGSGEMKDYIDIGSISRDKSYEGKYGRVRWRKGRRDFVRTDLNRFFGGMDREHPGNPEDVCAYAVTYIYVPTRRKGLIEISASHESGLLWLNRRRLTRGVVSLHESPRKFKVTLEKGLNELLIKLCERVGGWFFSVRITDVEGNEFNDIKVSSDMQRYEKQLSESRPGEVEVEDEIEVALVPPARELPRPSGALSIKGHGPGLVAEYFYGIGLSGEPELVKVESTVDFDYPMGREEEKPLLSPFSARWTGNIAVPRNGVYRFAIESDDGSRLYIDDRLVVDNWGEHGKEYRSGEIKLLKGVCRIMVEYFDAKWASSLRLLWKPPDEGEGVVPEEALSH